MMVSSILLRTMVVKTMVGMTMVVKTMMVGRSENMTLVLGAMTVKAMVTSIGGYDNGVCIICRYNTGGYDNGGQYNGTQDNRGLDSGG